MTNQTILSWFKPTWQQLPLIDKANFPQSVLLTGKQGIGRNQFISQLIQLLLCQSVKTSEEGQALACGQCQSCHLFTSNNHADFYQLKRLENKQTLGVDQVRSVIDWVELTTTLNHGKVLFIAEAEKLSISASNAILKTLEEPPENTTIILLSEYEKQVLPTIRSRCVHYLLPSPDTHQAREFLTNWYTNAKIEIDSTQIDVLLKICQNAPFDAIDLTNSNKLEQRKAILNAMKIIALSNGSPVHEAKELMKLMKKEPLDYIFYCFFTMIIDILKLQNLGNHKHVLNIDYFNELNAFSNLISQYRQKSQIFSIYDELQRYFEMTVNPLNAQLLLESYLIKWKNCCLNS
ncbi:MAG: hypothetical protein HQL46_12925 [Gammaproteobacteria bacterium]|nr:hypothetical protein [Gammaproteobacteria bacterium]